MMQLLSLVLDLDRDSVVNQLCAIIVPPLLIYIGLLCVLGEKIANQLLHRDTYRSKEIKIRMYAFFRTSVIGLLMILAIAYFSIYRIWDMVVLFAFALLGYVWIKVNTYCIHLVYTYRYLRFTTFKKTLVIPFADISKICWETRRGAIAYTLIVYYNSGSKIYLSSSDFIGLKELKSFYDSGKYKE